MTPKQADADNRSSSDLFRERLDNLLNQRHTLYRLADLITWSVFDREFGSLYCPDNGSPGKPMRLMVGLQYLKHCYGLSDEAVVAGWVENPYWQYFCGETHFQHVPPIDPSSLTRFRQRIGESGCERIFQVTVSAGVASRAVKADDFKRVSVDTTAIYAIFITQLRRPFLRVEKLIAMPKRRIDTRPWRERLPVLSKIVACRT